MQSGILERKKILANTLLGRLIEENTNPRIYEGNGHNGASAPRGQNAIFTNGVHDPILVGCRVRILKHVFSVSALSLTLTLNTGKTFEMALKKKKTSSDIKAIRVRARMFM